MIPLKVRMWSEGVKEMTYFEDMKIVSALLKDGQMWGLFLRPTDGHVYLTGYQAYMLFTGAKDKHGGELYAGDIVQQHRDHFIIEQCVGGFDCRMIAGPHKGSTFVFSYLHQDHFEIVGNIYANPELLEAGA